MSLRHLAGAAVAGTIAAAIIEIALQNALAAARVTTGSLTPWWVVGNVLERAVWVVAASITWLIAPLVAAWWRPAAADRRELAFSRASALRAVAAAMIVLPLVWMLAANLVRIAWITAAGAWAVDGRLFVSAPFYVNALARYAAWAGAGAVLFVVSRHVAADHD